MIRVTAVVIAGLLVANVALASESPIEWQVATPYALLDRLDRQTLPQGERRLWEQIAPTQDESMTNWVNRLTRDFSSRSPFDLMSDEDDPWDEAHARYRPTYVFPSATRLLVRATDGLSGSCLWSVERGESMPVEAPCTGNALIDTVSLGDNVIVRKSLDGQREHRKTIRIETRRILAMGDSYASGEGNPDVPTQWKPEPVQIGKLAWLNKSSSRTSDARWWDHDCHRSFWSNQNLASLWTAARHPQTHWIFLQYSCSGAEVLDGMLVGQDKPPGNPKGRIARSQLAQAAEDSCRNGFMEKVKPNDAIRRRVEDVAFAKGRKLYFARTLQKHGIDLQRCVESERANADLILLSIGGNDIGFAALASHAIAPSRYQLFLIQSLAQSAHKVCPQGAQYPCEPTDVTTIGQLPRRYALLREAMAWTFGSEIPPIVQVNYPDPLWKVDGNICGDTGGKNPDGPWTAAVVKLEIGAKLEFNVLEGEAHLLSNGPVRRLTQSIAENPVGETLVDVSTAFHGHSWCDSRNPRDLQPLSLPSFAQGDSRWNCSISGQSISASPACFKPYAATHRFIRTVNDSKLTQTREGESGINGAMHPNVFGHAAIAERLVVQLKLWVDTSAPRH